jgi:flagellar biosynthesis/type III secretory pathway chaperone
MTAILQELIEALRNELQQYGEMLALLEQQHQAVKLRGAEEVWQSITAINSHSAMILRARQTRQDLQRQLAEALSPAHDCSFTHLIPALPESYRPLVTALVQENNELLWRVRQRAQQNHLLLQQSVELMQQFLATLSPADQPAALRGEEHSVLVEQTGPAIYEALV